MTDEEYYANIRALYGRWAWLYDVVVSPIWRLRNRVVKLAGAPEGARVIDVATGTGKQAFAFARQGYGVVGVDLTPEMLRIASHKNKYKKASFRIGDATQIPFDDNEFDTGCISLALHDRPEHIREKALQEMFRVTRPGGILVILDYRMPDGRLRKWLVNHLVKAVESAYFLEFIQGGLAELLARSGFTVDRETPVLWGMGVIVRAINAGKTISQ